MSILQQNYRTEEAIKGETKYNTNKCTRKTYHVEIHWCCSKVFTPIRKRRLMGQID